MIILFNSEKWEYFRKNVLLKIENKLNNVKIKKRRRKTNKSQIKLNFII